MTDELNARSLPVTVWRMRWAVALGINCSQNDWLMVSDPATEDRSFAATESTGLWSA